MPTQKILEIINYLDRVLKKLNKASGMTWITDTGDVDELSAAIKRLREVKAEIEQADSDYDYLVKRAIQIEADLAIMKAHVEKIQDRLTDVEVGVFGSGAVE
jgi:hypothetical protein